MLVQLRKLTVDFNKQHFIIVCRMEFYKTKWSCPWNCDENSARDGGGHRGVGVGGGGGQGLVGV